MFFNNKHINLFLIKFLFHPFEEIFFFEKNISVRKSYLAFQFQNIGDKNPFLLFFFLIFFLTFDFASFCGDKRKKLEQKNIHENIVSKILQYHLPFLIFFYLLNLSSINKLSTHISLTVKPNIIYFLHIKGAKTADYWSPRNSSR